MMSKISECDHDIDDYELVKACRNCSGVDLEEREISSSLFGSYCVTCKDFTMVSWAERCPECGFIEWVFTMDEEIFDD
jgi:hypothetical protein